MSLSTQLFYLLILAIPVACIAWTVTQEEVFREPRELCKRESEVAKSVVKKKFFYLFTCEYCFSHYVAAGMLLLTKFQMLYTDWRGYLIAGFCLVWIANLYMGIYMRLRIVIKKDRLEAEETKISIEEEKQIKK